MSRPEPQEPATTCALCSRHVEHYSPDFHRLRIDDDRSVDICDECTRKFVRWQGEKIAKLFPTNAMNKLQRKNR